MIDFDYKLKQKEADGKVYDYKPAEKFKNIDNIAFIEGPNSSGKSTLLNVMAISLWGQKTKDIHPSLIDKMNDLMNSDYNKLSFNIKIKNKSGTIELISEKSSTDSSSFKVYEIVNGVKSTPLSPEVFQRKYNLIYDIPTNPIQRLLELTKDIESEQEKINGKIDRFSSYVDSVLQKVNDTKKIDEIAGIEQSIKQRESENSFYTADIQDKEEVVELLEKYLYGKFYQDYFINNENLTLQAKRLEGELKLLERKENRLQNKDNQIKKEIIDGIASINTKVKVINNSLPILLKDQKNHLKAWERAIEKITPEIIINDGSFTETFDRELKFLIKQCDSFIDDYEKSKIVKEANFYERIISLLKEYESYNIAIPGIEKDIKEFIKGIEAEFKKNEAIMRKHSNISDVNSQLNEILILKTRVETKVQKLKENYQSMALIGSINNDYDAKSYELKKKVAERDEIAERMLRYKEECAKRGIEKSALEPNENLEFTELSSIIDGITRNPKITSYLSYLEEQLNEEIARLHREIRELESKRSKNLQFIEIKIQDLVQLRNITPHKYQNDLAIIEKIFESTYNLKSKFDQEYKNYIEIAINKDQYSLYSDKDKDMKKYFSEIYKYLGSRVGYILHENEYLKVKEINILKREIVTETRTVRFMNMGTGQNQAAYLLGKINSNDKNKVIIALLDEVSMMDDNSLDLIFSKFHELYANDLLMAGIVVQKASKTNVTSKVKV